MHTRNITKVQSTLYTIALAPTVRNISQSRKQSKTKTRITPQTICARTYKYLSSMSSTFCSFWKCSKSLRVCGQTPPEYKSIRTPKWAHQRRGQTSSLHSISSSTHSKAVCYGEYKLTARQKGIEPVATSYAVHIVATFRKEVSLWFCFDFISHTRQCPARSFSVAWTIASRDSEKRKCSRHWTPVQGTDILLFTRENLRRRVYIAL